MAPRDDFEVEEDDEGNKYARMTVDQATAMREQARMAEVNRLAAEAGTEAQRKLAFYEAGIDIKSDLGELFFNGYKGEMTAEAIVTAAAKYPDLVTPVVPAGNEGGEQLTPEQIEAKRLEAEETAARQQLASGATQPGEMKVDPIAEAAKVAEDIRGRGGNTKTAQVGALNTLVAAAVAGDKRVLVDPKSGQNATMGS